MAAIFGTPVPLFFSWFTLPLLALYGAGLMAAASSVGIRVLRVWTGISFLLCCLSIAYQQGWL